MVSRRQQATAQPTLWQVSCAHPGSTTAASLTTRTGSNPGDPIVGAEQAHVPTSLKSEEGSIGGGKSEVSIVATNAGNAAGAKGHQFKVISSFFYTFVCDT